MKFHKIVGLCLITTILVPQAPSLGQEGLERIGEILEQVRSRTANHPEFSGRDLEQLAKSGAERSGRNTISYTNAASVLKIDESRSLFIRDNGLLSQITIADIMAALALDPKTGKLPSKDAPLKAFQNWWRLAKLPKVPKAKVPGCKDDRLIPGNYRYTCERGHAELANDPDVFGDKDGNQALRLVAAVNRGDLGNEHKKSCGEFRLIFQKDSDYTGKSQKHSKDISISFEAVVLEDNDGPKKCSAIQRMWHAFSSQSADKVAKTLRLFFIEGITLNANGQVVEANYNRKIYKVSPVISRQTLGARTVLSGQIRTNINSVSNGKRLEWIMREYAYAASGDDDNLYPALLGGSLNSQMFRGNDIPLDRRREFASYLKSQAGSLWGSNINTFAIELDQGHQTKFGTYEMRSVDQDDYRVGLLDTLLNTKKHEVVDALEDIEKKHSTSPGGAAPNFQTSDRLTVLSCSGCHKWLRNDSSLGFKIKFPASPNFTHVKSPDDNSYELSRYLKEVALPYRKEAMKIHLVK